MGICQLIARREPEYSKATDWLNRRRGVWKCREVAIQTGERLAVTLLLTLKPPRIYWTYAVYPHGNWRSREYTSRVKQTLAGCSM